MTKPTQDKETLREAVARAIAETEGFDPAMDCIEGWYETADAAIATMFERLRDLVPAIYEGPDQFLRKADVLAAFQQENSDGR